MGHLLQGIVFEERAQPVEHLRARQLCPALVPDGNVIGDAGFGGQGEADEGQYDGMASDVPALCAAAMLCRRDALLDLDDASGIFDESFFVFKDDLDLSVRLRKRGDRQKGDEPSRQ